MSEIMMERYAGALMHTFNPAKVFVKGQGTQLYDSVGRSYTDFLSGLAVSALGHCHPEVTEAVTKQLSKLDHISNLFASPTQIALAEQLVSLVAAHHVPKAPCGELTKGDGQVKPIDSILPQSARVTAKVFFGNSGAEANEAAFKLTRLTGRTRIIAMEGSFHGRTLGSLAITSTPKYREPFEPLPGDVTFIPFGDVDALAAAVDESVAAVVLEPIQGENGVVVPSAGYLAAAREITEAHGALLWVDEIQTGLGRCGEWLVSISEGVLPDIVTVAKGLGNGFPIGACIATGHVAEFFTPGAHGTTFGGNPVAAAAGLAVLNVLSRDGLIIKANELGARLERKVLALDNPLITGVRGRGLLRGIVLAEPVAVKTYQALLASGWIVNAPRESVIRVAPPLIVTPDEIDEFAAALDRALRSVTHG
ncbi:MAG: acetylornithine transaminase [Propionibacteriaceae bacterium]|jgi:acetylornithine aminotransferase|nr:acetylornithine transaminase [Propionibacteriaceae bacterium]